MSGEPEGLNITAPAEIGWITIAQPRLLHDLLFRDDKGSLMLDPQPDATPLEAIRIAVLVGMMTCGGGDWREYVERHGLARHFKEPK